MRETNLRSVDLNLLVLLDALITHRSVTQAAAAAHLSQPAMSRALGRLRHLLGDALLVRGPSGAVLTPQARALAGPVRRILADVSELVAPAPFDPARWTGEVTLAATDHQTVLLLPALVRRLAQKAPGLDVRVVPFTATTMEQLRTGEVEAGFGLAGALPAGFLFEPLYDDRFVTLMREGHPAVDGLTRERFVTLSHILVTVLGEGPGALDRVLGEAGLSRRVALKVPHFHAALAVAAATDFVVTLPVSLARGLAPQFGLAVRETPIPTPGFTLALIWSPVLGADPAQAWLRAQVKAATADAGLSLP